MHDLNEFTMPFMDQHNKSQIYPTFDFISDVLFEDCNREFLGYDPKGMGDAPSKARFLLPFAIEMVGYIVSRRPITLIWCKDTHLILYDMT